MRNLDKIKNAKSDFDVAKMLAFKVAQEICGNLNDQDGHQSFKRFHETKERFENEFLKWLKEGV